MVGKAMGITYVTGPVRGPTGEEALPKPVWEAIGLEPFPEP